MFWGEALGRFNPWMSNDAIRSVVERLEAIPATIEGNREMLSWLRGERQLYDEDESRYRRVQIIDFEQSNENVLCVTWEWRLRPPARKANRADVMFVVNGVPVAIVEHKNPTDRNAIDRGIGQLKRYELETPELIGAAQLFQCHPSPRLLVRRDVERQSAFHGALEGTSGGELPICGAVIL